MPATTTDNLEHFALDGPLGLPMAALVAAGLLFLLAWALRREASVIGKGNAVLFWLLRAAALAVVLWMLMAPTAVRVQRTTIRQAIALVTDFSRSMSTVDPEGTADDVRWALTASEQSDSATELADRALAAAGLAEQHLGEAARALSEHRGESSVTSAAAAAQRAIQRIDEHVAQVASRGGHWQEPSARSTGRSAANLADRIRQMLDGPEFKSFADLTGALERGRTPSQQGWRESLPDLEHRLASIRRQLVELARVVAAGERDLLQREHAAAVTATTAASRLTRVGSFLESLQRGVLAALSEKADVRYSMFDSTLTALPSQEDPAGAIKQRADNIARADDLVGMKTNLAAVFEELSRVQQQQPLAAVFLSTDAIHNDPDHPDPRAMAAKLQGTPVYVVPIGNTRHVRDLILQSVLAPNIAMRNDDVVIEASLQAYDCAGETCTIELLQNGEVIDQQTIDFDSQAATRTVRFERRMSEVGVHQFQLSISPLAGELTDENNFDHFEVNVTRGEIKVLLADEMPRWEYRYLTQLFRRAPKIDCDELLFRPRMIATGKRAESQSFPVTVADWDQYDVVILGDVATNHLPVAAQETLVEYLRERGGTLIMIAGHEYMPRAYLDHPLEEILPVKAVDPQAAATGDFRFYLTELGREHDALTIAENAAATRLAWEFVNDNAPLTSLPSFRCPLPTARTLIGAIPPNSIDREQAAKQSAFLCWQPIKRGRIVYFSGGETYRLRYLRGDRLHYPLWGQLLRWAIASDLAAGSQQVRIRTDKSRYRRNEVVQVLVRLADPQGAPVLDEAVAAIATRADQQQVTIPLVADEEVPGQYRGEFRQPEPGVYRIEPSGSAVASLVDSQAQQPAANASFTVRADTPLELLDTRCDLALANQIADATGGQVLPPTAVAEVVGLTDLEPQITETVEAQPLWVRWQFLWIVFACLQTEWMIRKWKGLS